MKDRMRVLLPFGILLVLIVLGLIGYFAWINIAFVDTLHARVAGTVAHVRAPGPGRIESLPIELGDAVAMHEELGALELIVGGASPAEARVLVPLQSPLAGIVVEKPARDGEYVAAGQIVATLVDPEDLWVIAQIHESRIPQVRVGQSVRIRIRTRSLRRTFWGEVQQVSSATTNAMAASGGSSGASASGRSEALVRISIDPAGYSLYPGMTAEVRVKLKAGLW